MSISKKLRGWFGDIFMAHFAGFSYFLSIIKRLKRTVRDETIMEYQGRIQLMIGEHAIGL